MMFAMAKLILVKHARPTIDPEKSPSQWELSDEGRAACAPLADALVKYSPAALVCSREIKARQTAEELAKTLNLSVETRQGLHEHDRDDVPHLPTREFLSLMALAYKQPKRKVLGAESLEHARERLLGAIDGLIEEFAGRTIAVVTHGTVISLAINYHTGQDGYAIWRRMQLPSFAVLSLPGYELEEVWPREMTNDK